MINDYTRHQIYIQRLAGGIYNRVEPELKKIRDELLVRLQTSTEYESQRIRQLILDINSIIDAGVKRLSPQLIDELQQFAIYESEYATKILDNAVIVTASGVTSEQIISAFNKEKMRLYTGEVMTPEQAIAMFSSKYKGTVESMVRGGIVTGATTNEIVRDIRLVVNNRTSDQAKALVTTLTNHAGSVARSKIYSANKKLFSGEEYHATLDSRTTLICASLDGKVYDIGQAPQPPLHYRCRSIVLPVIRPELRLDIDTTRASVNGPVSDKLTYNGWLKRQPASVQDEVLGATRGKAYRSGDLTIDKFIDKTGRTYTLDELRAKDIL